MRIVIDMQGAQAENRTRGIGRYTTAITKAIIRNSGTHEIILALNGLFNETIEPIRAEFNSIIDQKNIRVWYACTPTRYIDIENDSLINIAELTYEAFLAEQNPDFIYVSSLFEGLVDDAVTSIHKLQNIAPVAVTLYDLIPYINPRPYLENPSVKRWYLDKIEHIKQADIWLAISESSRQEGVYHLGLDPSRTHNISTDADQEFIKIEIPQETEQHLRQKYNLTKPFLMYTGGIDHRKNIEGLIRSYAKLPDNVKNNHQLAIVCSVQPESRTALKNLSGQLGLNDEDLILTGFVPTEDLVTLYNICHLFIFPSWHEGFGLPALEAMRCGAPVIGANTSSLPEVIGWEHALFDPKSDTDMAAAIEKGLTNENYRNTLLAHQRKQEKKFSWDESAKRAVSAMEQWHKDNKTNTNITHSKPTNKKLKLAYVSPLPPARSGIADYSAELLPELSMHYDIDVIVEQEEPVDNHWISNNLQIRNSSWLVKNKNLYDRVLYHFGNSSFHQHMFELIEKVPGMVVLHDFYLSGIQAHRDVTGASPGAWADSLFDSHGYQALFERFTTKDTADVVWKYPTNLKILQKAKGLVIHSEHSKELSERWYGINSITNWNLIPHLRNLSKKNETRNTLGFDDEDLIICSFGLLGPTKLNHRLLDAWLASPLAQQPKAKLIFVGQCDSTYEKTLRDKIIISKYPKNIKITGWADSNLFTQYLNAADIGVQLRALSRGETSGTVLDCMNYGLPTIVNAHGSMSDIDPTGVLLINDAFSDHELINALTKLAFNPELRATLGNNARKIIKTKHNPKQCAQKYFTAIEKTYNSEASGYQGLIQSLTLRSESDIKSVASSLAQNFPPKIRLKQLLVDISELVQRDAKSGIQRVVRAILQEWLTNPPIGYRVEPVYAQAGKQGYFYARRFTYQFMGIPYEDLQDDLVDAWQGDIFFILDLQPKVQTDYIDYYRHLRQKGVIVKFMVYDLLCVNSPEYFIEGAKKDFSAWLEVVAQSDGAICISKTVANELLKWLHTNAKHSLSRFTVEYNHLGSDIDNSLPTRGTPTGSELQLREWHNRHSFLMIGTIEPRKGHSHVLASFEKLWNSGIDVTLIIVGKQGWMVESFINYLRNHPEFNKRLFWPESVSDEFLEGIYSSSCCLIAASYGEGFGLPIIEAAHHKIPIIARDIPVFREVAGDNAFYFDGTTPEILSDAIKSWLSLFEHDEHPKSEKIRWITWKQSAQQLTNILIHNHTNKLITQESKVK